VDGVGEMWSMGKLIDSLKERLSKNSNFSPLSNFQYRQRFGIYDNKSLLKEAYNKAWEIRNFEIDKLWSRVAYFWGFIALIFGGYITIVTGEHHQKAEELNLDLYLILLGIIFSIAWLFVIRGSKRWQENWEAHIDKLEDTISGPLYKTIYCTHNPFYSVSKINEILACVIIVVWIWLFIQHSITKYKFVNPIKCFSKINGFVTIPIVLTICCIIKLVFCGKTSGGEFKTTLEKDEHGRFIDRTE
jgi:hypothetical protein